MRLPFSINFSASVARVALFLLPPVCAFSFFLSFFFFCYYPVKESDFNLRPCTASNFRQFGKYKRPLVYANFALFFTDFLKVF